MPTDTKTHGTAVLNCRNHPSYRWVQTKYSLPEVARQYMGSGVLIFRGDSEGKPAGGVVLSEAQIAALPADDERRTSYLQRYTPECDCPGSDLQFLHWAK